MLAVGFPAVTSQLQFGISDRFKGLSNLKTRGSLLGSNLQSASVNLKTRAALIHAWSVKNWQGGIGIAKSVLAGGLIIFMMGGFEPVVHLSRSLYWNKREEWSLEPFFLWVGAFLICRELDPFFPATEAGKIVKLLLKFVKSVSATLASDYCLLSLNQGLKFKRKDDVVDTRNTGLSFVNKVVFAVLCVVATLSLIELLGFSHPKLAMGRLIVLVLLMVIVNDSLAKSRPISMQVHATGRPHFANEEIKTESEGYGTIALTSEEEGKASSYGTQARSE